MKRLFLQAVCLLMGLCLLCGCGPSREPEEVLPVCQSVIYMVGGSLYESQTVELGMYPEAVDARVPGLEITGWLDEAGNAVKPETIPVTRDLCYTAQVKPLLDLHMPYLQLDANGYLNPEAPLTGSDLQFALQSLSSAPAHPFLPELPADNEVTALELRQLLYTFFPEEQVDALLAQDDMQIITRAEFALCMHTLLERDTAETFVLGASAVMPADVTDQRADAYILLEASMRHTPDPEGDSWQDMELPAGWEPGLHLEAGWLYYVNEDGTLLRDGDLGKLHFGTDGRLTSGDAELDALVAEKLNMLVTENPELEGLDLLRKVFDHCHQDYKYIRKDGYGLGATGWEVADAKEMLQQGRGNCYNFAAVFWALARGLGYDVQCLAGTCTGTDQPHGWVVLQYEGEAYFVDPEWQYAYTEREVFDHDMFMLTMDEIWYWTYRWDETQFSA